MLGISDNEAVKLLLADEFDADNVNKLALFFMSLDANSDTEKIIKIIAKKMESEIENTNNKSLYALSSLKQNEKELLLKKLKIIKLSITRIQRYISTRLNKHYPGTELHHHYMSMLANLKLLYRFDERIKYYLAPYPPKNENEHAQLVAIGIDDVFLQKLSKTSSLNDWDKREVQAKIIEKFDELGRIAEDEVALAIEIKKQSRKKKNQDFHAFAVNHEDIPNIVKMINDNLETTSPIRFQIALKIRGKRDVADGHWAFGEFMIIPTETVPQIKILMCDPLGPSLSLAAFQKFEETEEFKKLSKNADVRIFLSNDMLQTRPQGCSYFAIDGVSQLSNQENFQSVYDYMEKHGVIDNNHVVSSLPTRLLRMEQSMSSLKEKVLSTKSKNEIVNNKGMTFRASLKLNTAKGGRHGHNIRTMNKRKILKEKVVEFLQTIPDQDSYRNILNGNRIAGLQHYVYSIGKGSQEQDDLQRNFRGFGQSNSVALSGEKSEVHSARPKKPKPKQF